MGRTWTASFLKFFEVFLIHLHCQELRCLPWLFIVYNSFLIVLNGTAKFVCTCLLIKTKVCLHIKLMSRSVIICYVLLYLSVIRAWKLGYQQGFKCDNFYKNLCLHFFLDLLNLLIFLLILVLPFYSWLSFKVNFEVYILDSYFRISSCFLARTLFW